MIKCDLYVTRRDFFHYTPSLGRLVRRASCVTRMADQTATENPATTAPTNSALVLPTTGDAVWTEPDEKALIEYFIEHLSEAGDGKNFKKTTLEGAAKAVNLFRTAGGPKTASACGTKLKQVRVFVSSRSTTV